MSFIKQPDGRWAIWSNNIDNFTHVNCTKEEAIEEVVSRAMEDLRANLTRNIERLDNGEKLSQFTMTFNEAIEVIREVHGDEGVGEVLVDMELVELNET